jgi:hypothetical protein
MQLKEQVMEHWLVIKHACTREGVANEKQTCLGV